MTHLHIAALFTNSNNYVTLLLAVGDYGVICANPLLRVISNAPPEVCVCVCVCVRTRTHRRKMLSSPRLLSNLSDFKESADGHREERRWWKEKMMMMMMGLITRMRSAAFRSAVSESEDKQAHTFPKANVYILDIKSVFNAWSTTQIFSGHYSEEPYMYCKYKSQLAGHLIYSTLPAPKWEVHVMSNWASFLFPFTLHSLSIY